MAAIGGETMALLPDRALYWPARRRLLVADLHLGKADTFRQAGVALPRGGTAHDLERLSHLITLTRATSLWVLGDLLHGALVDTHWRGSWDAWRGRHAALEFGVVTGNHDRALRTAGLDVTLLGDVVTEGSLVFRHAPETTDDEATEPNAPRHVICGHLHPVVRLPGLPRRLPAFWLRPGLTVLPAFSAFTGGVAVTPAAIGDQVVACVDGQAIVLPSARAPYA